MEKNKLVLQIKKGYDWSKGHVGFFVFIAGIVFFILLKDKLSEILGEVLAVAIGIITILFSLITLLFVKDFIKYQKQKIIGDRRKILTELRKSINKEKNTSLDGDGLDIKIKLCSDRRIIYEQLRETKLSTFTSFLFPLLSSSISVILIILLKSQIWSVDKYSLEFTGILIFLIFYPIYYIIKFIQNELFGYLNVILEEKCQQ